MKRKELVELILEFSGLEDWKKTKLHDGQWVAFKKEEKIVALSPYEMLDGWHCGAFHGYIRFPKVENLLASTEVLAKRYSSIIPSRYTIKASFNLRVHPIQCPEDFDEESIQGIQMAVKEMFDFFERFSDLQEVENYANTLSAADQQTLLSPLALLRRMAIKRVLNTDDYHSYCQRIINDEFEKVPGMPYQSILRFAQPLYDYMNTHEPVDVIAPKNPGQVPMSEGSEPGAGKGNFAGFVCSKAYHSADEIAADFGLKSATLQPDPVELSDSTVSNRRGFSENEIDFFVINDQTLFIVPDIWISDLDFESASASQQIVAFRTYESFDAHQLTVYRNGKRVSHREEIEGKTVRAGMWPKLVAMGGMRIHEVFKGVKTLTGLDFWALPVTQSGQQIVID